MQGFLLRRGTAVITVLANAQPFQSGKLIAHFIPNEAQLSSIDASFIPMHNTLISSKSMQPNVELDCRDTAIEMRIPYIAPTNWNSNTNASEYYDWGTMHLTVLTPLRTGSSGSNSVDISIYMHFENFELSAPCIPQSNVSSKRFSSKVVNKEQLNLSGGKVSSSLSLAAKITNSLSSIPTLSNIMVPSTWVLNGLSGLASHFGWSKATLNELPVSIVNQRNRYGGVSDGCDTALEAALISNNRVSIDDSMTREPVDEMSFNYLKTIPCLTKTLTWNDTDVPGTNLFIGHCGPRQTGSVEVGTKAVSTHEVTYAVGPPISYLSWFFTQWRGSMKYTFKIAKTDFHSGRLQFTYIPAIDPTLHPNLNSSMLCLREIVDIRVGSEVVLHVPYLIASNYLDTNQSMGKIYVDVLNSLKAPETVSPSIDILVYVSGGEDFELQVFNNDRAERRLFSPQMDTSDIVLVDQGIGSSTIQKDSLQYAHNSVGECFTSVKQLISRYNPVYISTITANSATAGSSASFYPFASGVISMNASTGVLEGPTVGGDLFSLIKNMYVYYKGGMRVSCTVNSASTAAMNLIKFDNAYTGNSALVQDGGSVNIAPGAATTWVSSTAIQCWSGAAILSSIRDSAILEVPYYSRFKASFCTNTNKSSNYAMTDRTQSSHGANFTAMGTNQLSAFGVQRAARDDFRFSYFIGCPPIMYGFT